MDYGRPEIVDSINIVLTLHSTLRAKKNDET